MGRARSQRARSAKQPAGAAAALRRAAAATATAAATAAAPDDGFRGGGRAEVPLWDPHPPLPVLELLLLLNEPFNHSLQLWPI